VHCRKEVNVFDYVGVGILVVLLLLFGFLTWRSWRARNKVEQVGQRVAQRRFAVAIAARFNPLRRRIQNLIDKRFYRRKYNMTKVLAAFAVTMRDETDMERLTGEMLRVVDETMQPEFIGLWLRETPARSMPQAARPDSLPPR